MYQNTMSVFLDVAKIDSNIFWIFFGQGITVPSFIIVEAISWTIFSPYIKNLFLRLPAWDNELLSTPKIITFLAKLIPKFHGPALSNTIWYLLYR